MNIRPGRGRSLIGGVAALLVTLVGAVMMSSFNTFQMGAGMGFIGIFRIVWIVFGLVAAGASFYNAFSDRGLPLYEVEVDNGPRDEEFCPQCGKPVGSDDRFCRHCAAPLS